MSAENDVARAYRLKMMEVNTLSKAELEDGTALYIEGYVSADSLETLYQSLQTYFTLLHGSAQ
jgi:hypothetical protein